ncbi:hypothetical protein AAVH_11475 [Aphelenchoides avenae]|nr:hypothetical protein AAVH_11475 [Aphelenchus avenae]
MIALPKFLCTALKCDIDALPGVIRDDTAKVKTMLEGLPLYHSVPGSGGQLTPVKVDGVTFAGVSTLYGKGGSLATTVEQICQVRHELNFNHRQLQCIIQQQGVYGGEIYIPIEVVKVDRRARDAERLAERTESTA